MCVSLGLKKSGDSIVSEGHGYPLVVNDYITTDWKCGSLWCNVESNSHMSINSKQQITYLLKSTRSEITVFFSVKLDVRLLDNCPSGLTVVGLLN